ncbi:MAG TPA: hypothetical protein VD772_02360, partial [Anseongella sp.]|nr:hypothetical protein [Anseongella sp.]
MNSDGKYAGTGHLTPGTIRDYLGSKLSQDKMHEIEMHLLECGFCADAVEGFELSERSNIKTERSLLILRKRLNEKLKQHERPRIIRWPAWSAAAGIALAIAGYVLIMQQEQEQQQLAVQQSEAFLQAGSDDTLLIFMPAEPSLVASAEVPAYRGARKTGGSDPGNAAAGRTRAALRIPEATEVEHQLSVQPPDSLGGVA